MPTRNKHDHEGSFLLSTLDLPPAEAGGALVEVEEVASAVAVAALARPQSTGFERQ